MINAEKNIVWLASYPKSGNTWFRAFLTALFSEENKVDINNLWVNHNYANQSFFNYATELNATELFQDEIDNLKPEVINYLSVENKDLIYVKVHEKYHFTCELSPMIPTKYSLIALYFIRNPLDIAVSFAHHNSWSLDKIIKYMNKNGVLNEAKEESGSTILSEQLGTWSEHVTSWTKNSNINIQVVSYEDMFYYPLATFKKAIKTIGLDYPDTSIKKAIEACKFEKLKQQEGLFYFKEKNPNAKSFFRSGKPGTWKEILSESQVNKIINNHKTIMMEFGYLP